MWRGAVRLIGAAYQETVAGLADGTKGLIRCDSDRILFARSLDFLWSKDQDFGTVTAKAIVTPNAYVGAIGTHNANAAVRFLQIHNKDIAPIAGDVPFLSFRIAAGSSIQLGRDIFGVRGLNLPLGFAWGMSTTLATYTAATAGDHSVWCMSRSGVV